MSKNKIKIVLIMSSAFFCITSCSALANIYMYVLYVLLVEIIKGVKTCM